MTDSGMFVVAESSYETAPGSLSTDAFWQGLTVWLSNPQVANRRLMGAKVVTSSRLPPSCKGPDIDRFVQLCNQQSPLPTDLGALVSQTLGKLDDLEESFNVKELDVEFRHGVIFLYRHLLLKNEERVADANREIIFLDFESNDATFIPFRCSEESDMQPRLSYRFKLSPTPQVSVQILFSSIKSSEDTSEDWLRKFLFPKLIRWIEAGPREKSVIPSGSLALIDVDMYNSTYNRLKTKFGPYFVKIWPEQTDPLKFVYEDLAIASYLLCLWGCVDSPAAEKPSFVDLGCGNGLLVHVLNEEGCRGVGLDLRSRKIWSLYPASTKLEVCSVVPSPETLYPEADWLIGNHSDELTPWIPLLAAQSSPRCKFFLLPCCPFDFWAKYQRKNSGNSQYTEYIEFVGASAEKCGFKVSIDKLRIPSTKRTCLVGRPQLEPERPTAQALWEWVGKLRPSGGFRARSAVEPVRNCTRLPKGLVEGVVREVAGRMSQGLRPGEWQPETPLGLAEAAELLSAEVKERMRKECGGLQTLLRNNHNVFQVQGGVVRFRLPKPQPHLKSTPRWKNQPCWFFSNHPSGCPLEDQDCSYKHQDLCDGIEVIS